VANYDVSADGERLLMIRGREGVGAEAVVVLNWLGDFRARGSARPSEGTR